MKYILSLMLCVFASACATGERILKPSVASSEEQAGPALEWNWSDPGAIMFYSVWLVVVCVVGYIFYKDFTFKKTKSNRIRL